MTVLAGLAVDSAVEMETDVLGGGMVRITESGVYNMTVELAYFKQSKGGAKAMEVHFKTDQGAQLRQTFWMTSGTAKGGNNFYVTQDGTKKYLPGFNSARALSLLTVGKEIDQLAVEEKVAKLWDYETKSEKPTPIQTFTDLIGQEVKAGVLKKIVDKTMSDGAGNYVPSGETREEFEVDKFFRTRDDMTVNEIIAKAETATFMASWAEKNNGRVVDRSTKDAKPPAVAAAAPASTGSSLFS